MPSTPIKLSGYSENLLLKSTYNSAPTVGVAHGKKEPIKVKEIAPNQSLSRIIDNIENNNLDELIVENSKGQRFIFSSDELMSNREGGPGGLPSAQTVIQIDGIDDEFAVLHVDNERSSAFKMAKNNVNEGKLTQSDFETMQSNGDLVLSNNVQGSYEADVSIGQFSFGFPSGGSAYSTTVSPKSLEYEDKVRNHTIKTSTIQSVVKPTLAELFFNGSASSTTVGKTSKFYSGPPSIFYKSSSSKSSKSSSSNFSIFNRVKASSSVIATTQMALNNIARTFANWH